MQTLSSLRALHDELVFCFLQPDFENVNRVALVGQTSWSAADLPVSPLAGNSAELLEILAE
jgi:hypothetical protein